MGGGLCYALPRSLGPLLTSAGAYQTESHAQNTSQEMWRKTSCSQVQAHIRPNHMLKIRRRKCVVKHLENRIISACCIQSSAGVCLGGSEHKSSGAGLQSALQLTGHVPAPYERILMR